MQGPPDKQLDKDFQHISTTMFVPVPGNKLKRGDFHKNCILLRIDTLLLTRVVGPFCVISVDCPHECWIKRASLKVDHSSHVCFHSTKSLFVDIVIVTCSLGEDTGYISMIWIWYAILGDLADMHWQSHPRLQQVGVGHRLPSSWYREPLWN